MLEKIKERILKNKNDKQPLIEYVKIFSKLPKANELLGSNDSFQKLKTKDVYD
jgi:hypothetical protein